MQISQRSPLSAQAMDSSGIRSRIARNSAGTICSTVTPSRLILLRQLRRVPDLLVGTDVDAPSDHQGP